MKNLTLLFCTAWFAFVNGGSHSLWLFATYIIGETPFPEFSAVLLLDDIPVGYYSLQDMTAGLREFIRSEVTVNSSDQHLAIAVFGDMHKGMKTKAEYLKNHFNLTTGVHVQQRLVGCELLGNKPGRMVTMEAFDGYGGFERHYDTQQGAHQTEWRWPVMKSRLQLDYDKWLYANVYQPMCISQLKKYLNKVKNRVMGKVKPRVRLLQKTLPDSGGVKVTCLATGFYPRHINLTLLRDGQPVSDHQITGGELLPNGDETYQMRRSLEVSAEELQHHHYTCTAEHLSLDNKLDIDLDAGPDNAAIIFPVLVVLVLCTIGATAAIILWKKRSQGQGSQGSLQINYIATSETVTEGDAATDPLSSDTVDLRQDHVEASMDTDS